MHLTYKKMIQGMMDKEKKSRKRRKSPETPWSLYLLECGDGSLYTGVTNNLERRLKMHAAGKASRYTRTHLPVTLRYQELCGTRTQALVRECQVKSFSKKKKEALLRGGVSGSRSKIRKKKTACVP